MGYSRAGYLSRGTNQASEAARTTTPRSISDPAKDGLLGLQRAVGNQAVTRLLRPSQVPAQQSGKPLDPATRSRMESFLGADFSQVRVHTDAEAAQSASAINALAYTAGRDIVFAAGQYAHETHAGRRMLAHELAHVVQQSSGPVDGSLVTGGIKLSDPSDRFEQEAELTAERVIAGRPVSTWTGGNAPASPSAGPALSVQRSNGFTPPPAPPPAPAPPDWLPASVRATAVHVQGDIWDVRLPSLGGQHWVGPHDQLQRFINRQGFGTAAPGEPLQAAHIVGTEHLLDIGSSYLDPKADGPCIAVAASLHSTWTTKTSNMQSKEGEMGGRATATEPRPSLGPKQVWGLYAELYSAHPEVQQMAYRIIYRSMPRPEGPPISAHRFGSPMSEYKGSPMSEYKGSPMPKPASPMGAGGRARAFGGAVASTAVSVLLNYLGGKVQQHLDEKLIKNDLDRLQPTIQAALIQKQTEVERLLQQTNMEQTIYANVHIEIIYSFIIDPDPGAGPMQGYAGTRFTGLEISTQDINREEGWIRTPISFIGHYDHHQSTYSVPVFDPAVKFLEDAAQWKREHPGSETPFDRLKEQRDREEGQPRQKYEFDRIRGTWVPVPRVR